jgi:hypothetical protein
MKNFLSLALLLAAGFTTIVAARASDITVQGANVSYSCAFFSNYSERLHITYSNSDLPAGTTVKLHWGLGGSIPSQDSSGNIHQIPISWQNPYGVEGSNVSGNAPGQDLVMTQTNSNPPTYEISLEADTHDRESTSFYTQFKFTFIQVQPSGTYYDRPGNYGYYEADFINNGTCNGPNATYPMSSLSVSSQQNN